MDEKVFNLISKILVATDGSECANKAIDFALDLAEKHSANVLILNVLKLPVYETKDGAFAVSPGMAGFFKDLRRGHERMLSEAASKAASAKPGVVVSTALLEGNPADQIVATASEGGFDVVVLGHGGEGRLKEFFLGSTSERVAHLAKCAVLIVK